MIAGRSIGSSGVMMTAAKPAFVKRVVQFFADAAKMGRLRADAVGVSQRPGASRSTSQMYRHST